MNKHWITSVLTIAVAVGAMSSAASAGVFAKYDGVDGEATDANHDKWIDVLSIDWGSNKPGGGAADSPEPDPAVRDVVITLVMDSAAPQLQEMQGRVIPSLTLEQTANYGGSRATYLKYELTNVMVTSYQVNASGNDEAGPPTVVVGNNFEEIKVTYTEYDDSGSKKGTVEAEFKVEKRE